MSKQDWFGRLQHRHPWLTAVGVLLGTLAILYEALYIHGNSVLNIFDWPFVVIGFIAFIGLVLEAISDRLSKTE
jgi:hypothetical protein